MALLIRPDGTEQQVSPLQGKTFTLDEMQQFVGGYIEIAYRLKDKTIMWVNEEGKIKQLPMNSKATVMYQEATGILDFIRGTVLVTYKGEVK